MRKRWRWISVTTLSLIVMLCGHHDAGTRIIVKSRAGRSHSHHHHHNNNRRSGSPSM